jgi:hypothetical protein
VRALAVWAGSERAFLQELCRQAGAEWVPHRKDQLFRTAAAALRDRTAEAPDYAVFLDEMEKLPARFLEIVRDLTDETGAPFVLVGEDELYAHLARSRRVWSRTMETLGFAPLSAADIIAYAREAGEIELNAALADRLLRASGGDFRLVKRDLGTLLRLLAAHKTEAPTLELVNKAIKAGLRPGPDNGGAL